MPDKIIYTARSVSTGSGRDGHVRTLDGRLDLDLAAPKEMGGSGEGSNPEQLFAAGYAACFHSALLLVAGRQKVDVADSTVAAEVGIGPLGDGFGLAVTLTIELPGVPADRAEQLVDAAHQVCPYSNATRGNIPVDLRGRLSTRGTAEEPAHPGLPGLASAAAAEKVRRGPSEKVAAKRWT